MTALRVDTPHGPAVLPSLTCELPFGTGYYMRDLGDCLRACVGTVTQTPYEQIPEMCQEGEMEAWAASRGLRVSVLHPALFADPSFRPGVWIGSTGPLADGGGWTHCVVCDGAKIIFNPDGWRYLRAGGELGRRTTWSEIAYGWEFTPNKTKEEST